MLLAISLLVLPSSSLLSALWLRLLLLLLLLLLVLRPFPHLYSFTCSLSVSATTPGLLSPSLASSFLHPPVSAPPLGFFIPAVRPSPGFSASVAPSCPSFAQSVSLPAPSPTPSGFSLLLSAPSLPVFPGVGCSCGSCGCSCGSGSCPGGS